MKQNNSALRLQKSQLARSRCRPRLSIRRLRRYTLRGQLLLLAIVLE